MMLMVGVSVNDVKYAEVPFCSCTSWSLIPIENDPCNTSLSLKPKAIAGTTTRVQSACTRSSTTYAGTVPGTVLLTTVVPECVWVQARHTHMIRDHTMIKIFLLSPF